MSTSRRIVEVVMSFGVTILKVITFNVAISIFKSVHNSD